MISWAKSLAASVSANSVFHVKHAAGLFSTALTFVLLPSAAVAAEKVFISRDGLVLSGFLYEAHSSVEKAAMPAIVMLHGCAGLVDKRDRPIGSYAFWAEHFQKLGYEVVLLDSYSPRSVRETCTQQDKTILPERERSRDAHAALAWLRQRPGIDPGRIHLLGWSNGAMTVLHAIKAGADGAIPGSSFRSAVAFYPGCATVAKERGYRTSTPLLIQSGAADDWTPAKPCEAFVAKLQKAGGDAEIDVYPGAHHSFDRLDLSVRYRPDVRNAASSTGRGATIGSDPAARASAIVRVTTYIQAQNGRPAKP